MSDIAAIKRQQLIEWYNHTLAYLSIPGYAEHYDEIREELAKIGKLIEAHDTENA
jgi:hypothetical protein